MGLYSFPHFQLLLLLLVSLSCFQSILSEEVEEETSKLRSLVREKRGAIKYKGGNKYWFTIIANNICGAGEGTHPDLFFEVFLRSGNKDWVQVTRTRTQKQRSSGEWPMAFSINYSPKPEQFVYIKVWDEDPVKNDYFGYVPEFSIFKDEQRNKEHKIVPNENFMQELSTCERDVKSKRKNYPFIQIKLETKV